MSVRSSQSGPCVSHLFFADDLILFSEASPKHARIMKSCLDLFCTASGQTVNFSKSVVFCFPNTCKELAKEISTTCGLLLTDNLGKYLGMPILHHPVNKSTYYSIVEKVHNRLPTWKSKCLSMAGRITLIQAVTSSTPIYAMQTTKLLMSICDDLDRIHRNFLWGGSARQSKVHLCQWDLVCRPKHKGGLGLQKTSLMNQAMLGKIGRRLHAKYKGLWAKIYEDRCLQGCSILDNSLISRHGCSPTWKGILHGSKLLMQVMT
ncbi:unnamed protein product [Prunus armeniaca]